MQQHSTVLFFAQRDRSLTCRNFTRSLYTETRLRFYTSEVQPFKFKAGSKRHIFFNLNCVRGACNGSGETWFEPMSMHRHTKWKLMWQLTTNSFINYLYKWADWISSATGNRIVYSFVLRAIVNHLNEFLTMITTGILLSWPQSMSTTTQNPKWIWYLFEIVRWKRKKNDSKQQIFQGVQREAKEKSTNELDDVIWQPSLPSVGLSIFFFFFGQPVFSSPFIRRKIVIYKYSKLTISRLNFIKHSWNCCMRGRTLNIVSIFSHGPRPRQQPIQ